MASGDGDVPTSTLKLIGNVPNPFNPATTIRFIVPGTDGTASHTTMEIFDISGRRVATLLDGPVPAGYRSVIWNGTSDRGATVSSGIYFVRIQAGDVVKTKKMALIR